eukprot:gene10474-7279_t
MFSGKKKKEQLQAKRERKRQTAQAHNLRSSTQDAIGMGEPSQLRPGEFKYGEDRHGIRSVFKKEAQEEVEARKKLNYAPLPLRRFMPPEGVPHEDWMLVPGGAGGAHGFPLSFQLPRRGWGEGGSERAQEEKTSSTQPASPDEIAAVEQQAFERYLHYLDTYIPPCGMHGLNAFERNIDVWRQLWRTVEASDVVVVVADSRYPILHLPLSLLRYIAVEEQKPCVILLNKSDLTPKDVLAGWTSFLPAYFCASGALPEPVARGIVIKTFTASPADVPTNASASEPIPGRRKKKKQSGRHYEALRAGRAGGESGSDDDVYDATENFVGMERARRALQPDRREAEGLQTVSRMISEILAVCRSLGGRGEGVSKGIQIGFVGHPNVGKSSLLNCIRGTKVVSVSATAGKTKHLQTIPIPEEGAVLIDSPGIVFPAAGIPRELQAVIGTHQIAQTRDPQSCVAYLAIHLPLENLLGLRRPEGACDDEDWCPYDWCDAYAAKRGFLVKHGKGARDIHRASLAILQEAFNGTIALYFAAPPVSFLSSAPFLEMRPRLLLPAPSSTVSSLSSRVLLQYKQKLLEPGLSVVDLRWDFDISKLAMASPALQNYTFDDDYVNPRGIPRVHFVEDIAKLVKSSGGSAENLLKRLSEQHSKYKLAEHKLIKSTANLEAKIPDIKKTLQTIRFLKKQLEEEEKGFTTNYGLTESVFCEAEVPPQKTVHLWLGANVMVEYPFDEAIKLLERNLASATENLAKTQEDLVWLQEQQTVLEVNTSRVYNYDVVERRKAGKNLIRGGGESLVTLYSTLFHCGYWHLGFLLFRFILSLFILFYFMYFFGVYPLEEVRTRVTGANSPFLTPLRAQKMRRLIAARCSAVAARWHTSLPASRSPETTERAASPAWAAPLFDSLQSSLQNGLKLRSVEELLSTEERTAERSPQEIAVVLEELLLLCMRQSAPIPLCHELYYLCRSHRITATQDSPLCSKGLHYCYASWLLAPLRASRCSQEDGAARAALALRVLLVDAPQDGCSSARTSLLVLILDALRMWRELRRSSNFSPSVEPFTDWLLQSAESAEPRKLVASSLVVRGTNADDVAMAALYRFAAAPSVRVAQVARAIGTYLAIATAYPPQRFFEAPASPVGSRLRVAGGCGSQMAVLQSMLPAWQDGVEAVDTADGCAHFLSTLSSALHGVGPPAERRSEGLRGIQRALLFRSEVCTNSGTALGSWSLGGWLAHVLVESLAVIRNSSTSNWSQRSNIACEALRQLVQLMRSSAPRQSKGTDRVLSLHGHQEFWYVVLNGVQRGVFRDVSEPSGVLRRLVLPYYTEDVWHAPTLEVFVQVLHGWNEFSVLRQVFQHIKSVGGYGSLSFSSIALIFQHCCTELNDPCTGKEVLQYMLEALLQEPEGSQEALTWRRWIEDEGLRIHQHTNDSILVFGFISSFMVAPLLLCPPSDTPATSSGHFTAPPSVSEHRPATAPAPASTPPAQPARSFLQMTKSIKAPLPAKPKYVVEKAPERSPPFAFISAPSGTPPRPDGWCLPPTAAPSNSDSPDAGNAACPSDGTANGPEDVSAVCLSRFSLELLRQFRKNLHEYISLRTAWHRNVLYVIAQEEQVSHTSPESALYDEMGRYAALLLSIEQKLTSTRLQYMRRLYCPTQFSFAAACCYARTFHAGEAGWGGQIFGPSGDPTTPRGVFDVIISRCGSCATPVVTSEEQRIQGARLLYERANWLCHAAAAAGAAIQQLEERRGGQSVGGVEVVLLPCIMGVEDLPQAAGLALSVTPF